MTAWHFKADGFVYFGSFESKVDDNWLVTSYGGDYALSSNRNSKGEYTASCHFILKESRLMPENKLISQSKHDERKVVYLKRDGQALLVNDVRHEKRD
jgi:hypothetical protein